MADVPHAWPACLLEENKQTIRFALVENQLQISNVNAFMMKAISDPRQKYWHPSWIEPDRHYRQIRIDHTKRALTLAKELGVGTDLAPYLPYRNSIPLERQPPFPGDIAMEERITAIIRWNALTGKYSE